MPRNASRADLYNWLSAHLKTTHKNAPKYQPSKHLYPWIDLHDDLQLRSIYSGRTFDPEEFIREDLAIEEMRTRQTEALQSRALESSLDLAELDLLEANLPPFNCEHVVPQSWFKKREPMRGDLHHLFACERRCNSFRSNTPYFDFADFPNVQEKDKSECGRREENAFEPEANKGSVARAVLYFLLRYPGEINKSVQEYTPDRIKTLITWHEEDRVTKYELHRNAGIFEKQGNRNPLIDFPDLAAEIDFLRGLGPS
jgi:endonuclease I